LENEEKGKIADFSAPGLLEEKWISDLESWDEGDLVSNSHSAVGVPTFLCQGGSRRSVFPYLILCPSFCLVIVDL